MCEIGKFRVCRKTGSFEFRLALRLCSLRAELLLSCAALPQANLCQLTWAVFLPTGSVVVLGIDANAHTSSPLRFNTYFSASLRSSSLPSVWILISPQNHLHALNSILTG